MADIFSRQKRSEIMSRVKGRRNLLTELRLIELFRLYGFAGWRRNAHLFGHPDFVFPKLRVAIFVDGCFWHRCPIHGSMPKSNQAFWREKLLRNQERDRLVMAELKKLDWKPVRVWQHELREPLRLARRLRRYLDRA